LRPVADQVLEDLLADLDRFVVGDAGRVETDGVARLADDQRVDRARRGAGELGGTQAVAGGMAGYCQRDYSDDPTHHAAMLTL
jgi:hypothetical protein